jgi:hypothetical protein
MYYVYLCDSIPISKILNKSVIKKVQGNDHYVPSINSPLHINGRQMEVSLFNSLHLYLNIWTYTIVLA